MDDRTAAMLRGIIMTVYVGTWIVLGIVNVVASRRMSTEAKRRWWPPSVILAGVLVVFFAMVGTFLESRSWPSWMRSLLVAVPAIVLISCLNIKSTKFCDKCGSTQYDPGWFTTPMRFCSKCGAEFDTAKPSKNDHLLE